MRARGERVIGTNSVACAQRVIQKAMRSYLCFQLVAAAV
jgi:hypothetical protein